MISTSSIRISCVVAARDVERAVRALHDAFRLESGLSGAGRCGRRDGAGRHRDAPRSSRSASFPVSELRVYASPRSEGRRLAFAGRSVACEQLRPGCFDGLELVIVDVDDPLAAEWAPQAVAAGALVVDNSAAFRMDPDVPLVVAEINPEDLADTRRGIVSCPNCTTMVLALALAPLHQAAGLERLVVSTYQAVSGAGQPGIARARRAVDEGRRPRGDPPAGRRHRPGPRRGRGVAPTPSPGTSSRSRAAARRAGTPPRSGSSSARARRILHAPDLEVSPTCVRVPVYVGHSPQRERAVRAALPRETKPPRCWPAAPGVTLVDGGDGAPTPLEGGGPGPGARGPTPRGPVRRADPQPVGHRRQPPQRRGAERGPARRAAPRAPLVHDASAGRRRAG